MNKYSCIFYNFKDDVDLNTTTPTNTNTNTNNKLKKYKHKFVSKDFFVENELFVSKKISHMINYSKYFYIPSKVEKINFVNIDNENVENFETEYDINLKYRKKIVSNNILLQYENIPTTQLNNYLSSDTKYFFYKIIHIYIKLLKSINILNQNNIFFNNLNNENIIVNQFDCPILTNFQYSITINSSTKENLHKFILEYDPSYIQWPIEIHTMAFIFHNNLTSLSNGNIHDIVNELIHNNYIFDNFNDDIKQKYYNDGIFFLTNFVNKKKDDILTIMISYFKYWDNYATSILYLQIIIKIYKCIKNKKNKFISDFMKLLMKNISFDPNKRFSLKNTKIYFNHILNNITKSEYKEIINC
jgi:hypothetical protein